MSEDISLHGLGLQPYVLLTTYRGDEGDDDHRIGVEFGGGLENLADARLVMLTALPSLGVTAGELAAVAEEIPHAEPAHEVPH